MISGKMGGANKLSLFRVRLLLASLFYMRTPARALAKIKALVFTGTLLGDIFGYLRAGQH